MKKIDITLENVQEVYAGPEARLWELIMGEQIHAGGMNSSLELARSAGIAEGMRGIDLCCCLGGGVRFLVRHFGTTMAGVDATPTMIEEAKRRSAGEEFDGRVEYRLGDVTALPYGDGTFDFAWGEDAWCYVVDKARLVEEAARVVRPGGKIAFTDWVEGPAGLDGKAAERILRFMKFPYMESIGGYRTLLEAQGFEILEAREIDFAKYVDLYMAMLTEQLTSDALRILGGDIELFRAMGGEMAFMQEAAHGGRIIRGRFVARKAGG